MSTEDSAALLLTHLYVATCKECTNMNSFGEKVFLFYC